MATGVAQKSCPALFSLWSLRENDIRNVKKSLQRGNVESIGRDFNIK